MNQRAMSLPGQMARYGFCDAKRCAEMVTRIADAHLDHPLDTWIEQIACQPDPDLALHGVAVIDESDPVLIERILSDEQWWINFCCIMGSSRAFNDYLRLYPHDSEIVRERQESYLRDDIYAAIADDVGCDLSSPITDIAVADRLRRANRRQLMRIALRDLTCEEPADIVHEICRELSDLADIVMEVAVQIARGHIADSDKVRFSVIAMGKCGAREVNYLSDIDVLYVAEPADESLDSDQAIAVAEALARFCSHICSDHSSSGTIWSVDAALRPDGKAGALVRTLNSYRSYYTKWASNWEFQALLKARPMAGDLDLARQFIEMISPLVWKVGGQDHFMSETQAMRQRVIDSIPARNANREIKLGAGGLRDVEFSVQLLQLVHGRVDENLRTPATLDALQNLTAYGYIGRQDAHDLDQSYRFLRLIEHRQQLWRLRRTHLMPSHSADMRRLARQMRMSSDELSQRWKRVRHDVRRLQQRIFYSPLLDAVSHLPSEQITLSSQAAQDRLKALGFSDPLSALRHIEALTTGLTRTSQIQRQLMPAMLSWLSQGPHPDLGLLNFRRLSDVMGGTNWYMRALRDEGWLAKRLARLLSASRYIFDLLSKDPSAMQMLSGEEGSLRSRADLDEAMGKIVARYEDPHEAMTSIHRLRRKELFRIAASDVLDNCSVHQIGHALSDLSSATIDTALRCARAVVDSKYRDRHDCPSVPLGLIAMGRWGGGEMGYASDADAIFIVDDDADDQAIQYATQIASLAMSMLKSSASESTLIIDSGLRPDGKNGPLVRTVASCLSYYRRWSDIWESQALIRASHGAGDREITSKFLQEIDFRRYPEQGLAKDHIWEIRRLKARMEKERTTKRTAHLNVKLGPGGLSDIEWTVQLLQLRYAHLYEDLRVNSTIEAIEAARLNHLMSDSDAELLSEAWTMATQLRNSTMLVRSRPGDLLPIDPRETACVAMLLGYQERNASTLLERWTKTARRAQRVVNRLFWEES